jgi:hypothetical protein
MSEAEYPVPPLKLTQLLNENRGNQNHCLGMTQPPHEQLTETTLLQASHLR